MAEKSNADHIVNTPIREQVAVILKRKMLNKELLPGDTINLRKTAAELGISSMPVREALQILNNQGFVELRANKPAVVIGISANHVKDFFETLSLLESETARLAALRNEGTEELERISKLELKCIEDNDFAGTDVCNFSFHKEIRHLSGNAYLERIIDNLWTTSARGITPQTRENVEKRYKDHLKLIKAIKDHDAEKAQKYMQRYISRVSKLGIEMK